LIRIEHLSKRFGRRQAVRDLSLEIRSGEIYAFLGPNGAGKTTTIRMMTGLLRPDGGRVEIDGLDLYRNLLEVKRLLGYIPDQPYLYEKLTGREFIEFVAQMYGIGPGEYRPHLNELIERFQMGEYIDDLTEGYSHGMRQRVVFCTALIHRPSALVIDEPMVGLDPRSMRLVKDLLRNEAAQGCSIFVSTHLLSVVEETADRVGIIREGELLCEGTVPEIISRGGPAGRDLESVFLELTERPL
jgi:ABC-2 type transport system ATP-binding protein